MKGVQLELAHALSKSILRSEVYVFHEHALDSVWKLTF